MEKNEKVQDDDLIVKKKELNIVHQSMFVSFNIDWYTLFLFVDCLLLALCLYNLYILMLDLKKN